MTINPGISSVCSLPDRKILLYILFKVLNSGLSDRKSTRRSFVNCDNSPFREQMYSRSSLQMV